MLKSLESSVRFKTVKSVEYNSNGSLQMSGKLHWQIQIVLQTIVSLLELKSDVNHQKKVRARLQSDCPNDGILLSLPLPQPRRTLAC